MKIIFKKICIFVWLDAGPPVFPKDFFNRNGTLPSPPQRLPWPPCPALPCPVCHHRQTDTTMFALIYKMFILCFTTGKSHGCETFPKCRTMLGFCLILGPIFLEFPPPWGLYPTQNCLQDRISLRDRWHIRGARENKEGVPITCRCQFLTWDSVGKSTREEVDHSAPYLPVRVEE
jgi:hypothetical protein